MGREMWAPPKMDKKPKFGKAVKFGSGEIFGVLATYALVYLFRRA
jgi:hypothetical protein